MDATRAARGPGEIRIRRAHGAVKPVRSWWTGLAGHRGRCTAHRARGRPTAGGAAHEHPRGSLRGRRGANPAARRVRQSVPIRASTARRWRTSCAARRPGRRGVGWRSPSTRCGTWARGGRCSGRRRCRGCPHHKSASPCATARILLRSGAQIGRSGRRSRSTNPSKGPTPALRRRI